MNPRLFFYLMLADVFLSVLMFVAVLFFVDPGVSGIFGQLLFYGSVFFLVSGMCAILLFFIKKRKESIEEIRQQSHVSLQEGVLLGMLAVVMLVLQSFRVIVWWVVVFVGIVFLFLEVVLLFRLRRE